MSDTCMTTLHKPCASCPWRVDQTAQDIPNFELARAERLSACSPDEKGMGPDFNAKVFACHQSRVNSEFPCAGWLAKVGHAHPRIRFAVSRGQIPPESLKPGADWPALHDTYQDVLAKLRETAIE